ncbi:ROK family protein, partial [Eubacteriales bacterium OttesenSCG-928-A19]|nr:ROK family protein [Eubacteriales bacterium OttesenSCG-928-A19]
MLRIGVDFGGTKIAYGLYDEGMRLLDRGRVRTEVDAAPTDVIDSMARDITGLVARAGRAMSEVVGVGVGFPSHIDFDGGRVIIATNLPVWEDVPLRDLLSARLSLPVWVDNDTNTAALAEHRLGAGQGARHMAYMTISTGIGCGFIINGDMYRGTHGFAGELGQIFVSDTHGYGNERMNPGVIQSIASGPRLARMARERIAGGRESRILHHAGTPDAIDCEHIGLALAEDDALATEIVDFAAHYLGRTLCSLYELMDLGVIVYGGGVTKLGPRLTGGMIDAFYALSHGARKRPVDFRPAALGDDAG